jgi:hypothetical protein
MQDSTLQAVRACIEVGQPVLLVGEPGTAKTAMLADLNASMERVLETVIASTRDPADFGGYVVPHGADGEPELLAIGWARRVRKHVEAGRKVTVFFDEVNCAPPAVQAAMLRPVNERYVGDLYLGSRDEVAFIAAANPTEHAAGGWDLPPSMANRWLRLTWTVDLAKWSRYMAARGAGSVAMRSEVVSFLRARPDLLINVPASESEASKSWPSPRSWEALCRVGSEVQAGSSLGQATLADIAVGCVGAGAATEWLAFRQALDLPDPEVALADPEAFMPPERGDRLYAALTAIAASVAAKTGQPWSPDPHAFMVALFQHNRAAYDRLEQRFSLHAARVLHKRPE